MSQEFNSFPAAVSGSLSIDRCTFLLLAPTLSLWQSDRSDAEIVERRLQNMAKLVQSQLDTVLDGSFAQGKSSELFRHHFRTIDGIDIQFGPVMPKRSKIDDLGYLEAFGSEEDLLRGYSYQYSANSYGFRIEYNPNNTSLESVSPILHNFSIHQVSDSIRIARLDLAVDYPVSIHPELVMCQGMRKGFSAYGSKGLETLYFGSRQSKNFIRLYDKQKEQKEKFDIDIDHPLWRLELESKEAFFITDPPDHGKVFERFSFYDGGQSCDDPWLDLIRCQAMIYGLENTLRRFPRATQSRYRRKLKQSFSFQGIESPAYIYARDFPLKFGQLRYDILSACGFNVVDF